MLEGVVMPELWLTDALAAAGKPVFRVHTAGSVGGSTAIVAAQHVMAGIHERVLTIGFEKQSDGNAMWALSVPLPVRHAGPRRRRRLLLAAHPHATSAESGAPVHIGAMVAVKDRTNGCEEPATPTSRSRTGRWRRRWSRRCCGIRSASSRRARRATGRSLSCWQRAVADAHDGPGGVGPRHGDAQRADDVRRAATRSARGRARCAPPTCSRKAGITRPGRRDRRRRDLRALRLVRADVAGEPRLRRADHGWRFVEDGVTESRGALPVNPSGGVLSSNPIGASGMLRFGEAALQVMGTAGEHQVDGARRGARPRLRRRLAVLRHVGRRHRQAVSTSAPGTAGFVHNRSGGILERDYDARSPPEEALHCRELTAPCSW